MRLASRIKRTRNVERVEFPTAAVFLHIERIASIVFSHSIEKVFGYSPVALAFQKLYDYINSYLQPWFKADVQALLDQPDIAAARKGNYVGMHIRRTDKQVFDRAKFVPTEVKAWAPKCSSC